MIKPIKLVFLPKHLLLLGIVHTEGESLQDELGDVQTCGMTLASAYILHCLSTIWLQLYIIGRSSKEE